ncbi:hypothetical protein pW2_114 [Bacillus phage pW2]|uniref:HNH nuclease domain-containing protein n=1 Tax=Bacillus phage pW2 TaxID=2500559 RepID=A0A3T0IHU5_9CAUD|nr:HNH endonuclease [Bacillus phage pW2]AZU98946.1 hypothetical protein pW2_114 [Bacillus phage pW2]
MIYMPTHHRAKTNGMVYEHILVAERKLGRKLKSKEVVHHEDENKQNNNEENLFVFATLSDHTRYHHNGIKIKVEDYYVSPSKIGLCKVCNKNFEYSNSRQTGEFCSRECLYVGQRKFERPNKEELFNLIKTISFLEIGRIYGVSDNAVRKWCKSYDLPYRKKDINNLLL